MHSRWARLDRFRWRSLRESDASGTSDERSAHNDPASLSGRLSTFRSRHTGRTASSTDTNEASPLPVSDRNDQHEELWPSTDQPGTHDPYAAGGRPPSHTASARALRQPHESEDGPRPDPVASPRSQDAHSSFDSTTERQSMRSAKQRSNTLPSTSREANGSAEVTRTRHSSGLAAGATEPSAPRRKSCATTPRLDTVLASHRYAASDWRHRADDDDEPPAHTAHARPSDGSRSKSDASAPDPDEAHGSGEHVSSR